LTENVFKCISANSNPNLNPNPNPKAQKRFRKSEMTSFFGQVSKYHFYIQFIFSYEEGQSR